MADRRSTDAVWIFALIALVLGRRGFGGPVFPGEFIVEDFIVLLALAAGTTSPRIKPVIRAIVASAVSTTICLITAWTPGAARFTLHQDLLRTALFALIAVLHLARALVELLKLLRRPVQA
jgi:hypothetical protein